MTDFLNADLNRVTGYFAGYDTTPFDLPRYIPALGPFTPRPNVTLADVVAQFSTNAATRRVVDVPGGPAPVPSTSGGNLFEQVAA